eukprot:8925460-Pyramimonas_sp.AAC.1
MAGHPRLGATQDQAGPSREGPQEHGASLGSFGGLQQKTLGSRHRIYSTLFTAPRAAPSPGTSLPSTMPCSIRARLPSRRTPPGAA